MDFIDKQHIVGFEVGQHGRQITGFFQYRSGGGAQINAHFIGDNIRQCGFPEPRRAENQQMIEGIPALTGSLDKDFHL